tara:strand:+ start:813 stop:1508 length:696 start_codon:yes stop_codon:yes gene_type:complete
MSNILCVSDLHEPFSHRHSYHFLKAISKKYKFSRVVCIGDEVDYSALSFHDSDPDLPSATKELELAQYKIKKLEKLFPRMDLLHSNHGSLVYRKRKHHGFPEQAIKDYADILGVDHTKWRWHDRLVIKDMYGEYYFCHNMNKDPVKSSMSIGYNFIQGHYHTDFKLGYWNSPEKLRWGMTIGCLIDKHSLAFAYSRVNIRRPTLGCAVILNGVPQLIPMTLEQNGGWNGKI